MSPLLLSVELTLYLFSPLLQQLIEFGENRDLGTALRTYQQQIEKTKANIKWMNDNAEKTKKWLEDNLKA